MLASARCFCNHRECGMRTLPFIVVLKYCKGQNVTLDHKTRQAAISRMIPVASCRDIAIIRKRVA